MPDLVEDPQGLCPPRARGRCLTRAYLDVAEADQRVGLVEAIAEAPVDRGSLLVAPDRAPVVT
jgi:hypothetical protein